MSRRCFGGSRLRWIHNYRDLNKHKRFDTLLSRKGIGESMKNFLVAISFLSLALLGGCTGDDKESGTTDSADSAAE